MLSTSMPLIFGACIPSWPTSL